MKYSNSRLLGVLLVIIVVCASPANSQDNFDKNVADLKSNNAKIRAQAVYLLGKSSQSAAVPHLIMAAKDRSSEVRQKVAGALGKIGDSRGISTLISLMDDTEKDVRMTAGAGLKFIGEAAVYPLIREADKSDKEKKRLITFTLGLIKSPKSLPFLEKLAATEDLDVQWSAIWAMGEIGENSSIEVISRITLESNSAFLQLKGVEALEKLGGTEAEVAIKKYISRGSIKVKREAAKALNRMK